MKIQYKAAIIMTVFGAVIIILLSVGYGQHSYRIAIANEFQNIYNLSEEVALKINSHLREKTSIGKTLSSAPIIRDALLKSNSEFNLLPNEDRKQVIEQLNQRWVNTSDINDHFVQAYMTNSVASFLKIQQTILPGEYGEIFLTNRYGVMIASTGKLTTLSHNQKYWWLACFNEGQGRIFLDDRGFDTSVEGYVLGVVIPIIDKNKIIGLLKCNLNITGLLTDIVQDFDMRKEEKLRIVRTGGLIISERGVTPLSTMVNEVLVKRLEQEEGGSGIISENDKNQLIVYTPIEITMGSEQLGFGGKQESVDHILGNKGEAWQVVISLNEDKALEPAKKTTVLILIVGIIITFLTASVGLVLGKFTARPIIELANIAKIFGNGNLEKRSRINSNDEIGSLAKSLNKMAKNLQETMTSRDELIKINKDLHNAFDKIKTLSGLLPICANCKKIRDSKGYWSQIESYVEANSDVQFSHGLCEKCEKELYGDDDWYKEWKKQNT